MAFKVNTSEFGRALRDLNARTDRSAADNLQRYSRTILSNRQGTGLLEITPPAGNGATGLAAKRQGEAAIDRDLAAIFVPVRLKHERREQWPDVEGIHAGRFGSGSRAGKSLTRGRAQAYYVDVIKLRALRRLLFARVGYLASGWIAAAERLGVRIPSWIGRHGARRGSIRLQLTGPKKEVEISNTVPDRSPVAEVERRTQQAVNYATSRIQRDFDSDLVKNARGAGFRAA